MKANEWLLLFHDHLYCLDSLYPAGNAVPSTRKIKIRGSEFKFFVLVFQNVDKIIIQNGE